MDTNEDLMDGEGEKTDENTYVPSPKPEFEKKKKKILKPSRKSDRVAGHSTVKHQKEQERSLP